MMQDPAFLSSGIMPPILHPLKNPSKLTIVSDEFIHKQPQFKLNLPALYMFTHKNFTSLKIVQLITILHMVLAI